MARPQKHHELSLKILRETEKALQVTEGLLDAQGNQINHWLPKSQIDGDYEIGAVCILVIPEWLVIEKGLIVD